MDARQECARALWELWQAAGKPTSGKIASGVKHKNPSLKVTSSSWSNWLHGKHIPSKETVLGLVSYLGEQASLKSPSYQGQSVGWWTTRLDQIEAERKQRRGGRPANPPPAQQLVGSQPWDPASVWGESVPARTTVDGGVVMVGLPAAVSSFTGRSDDLEKVVGALAPSTANSSGGGRAPLVTVIGGLGGVGKTTLAVQAAWVALDRGWFAGGVLFEDMFGFARDADRYVKASQAVQRLLREMGVPGDLVPTGLEDAVALYRSLLGSYADAGRPVLVVIDNVADYEQVEPLLPTHAACRAIVTSRESLPRLDAHLVGLEELPLDEAVDLLDATLQARCGAADTRLADDPVATEELARLCGGLPLALEIVAALLAENSALTPTSLADYLAPPGQRLKEISDGRVSLTDVFDLSYQQLSDDDQKRLFRLLPVNHGPDISTAAAAALTGWDTNTTRHALVGLARANLIRPAAGTQRWRIHDLLRLYAQNLPHVESEPANGADDDDQAGGAGSHSTDSEATDDRQALTRLLDHYQTTTGQAVAHIPLPRPADPAGSSFPDSDSALGWLDVELDNLVAAITAAPLTDRHREFARDLPLTLARYLNWKGQVNPWITVATTSLHQAEHTNDLHAKAAAQNNLGEALYLARRFEDALTLHQKAATIYREEIEDRHGEGEALNCVGSALYGMRRFEEAVTNHTDAAAIFRETGDPNNEGWALTYLGGALTETRRFDEAIAAYTDAAAIFRATSYRHGQAMALNNLGSTLQGMGRFKEAITTCWETFAICRDTGYRHGREMALNNLGTALGAVGRFDEAITSHQEAVAICRESGDRHGQASATSNLGIALAQTGRTEEAITMLRNAAAIFHETADRHRQQMALNAVGIVLRKMGRFDEAITSHQEAVAICRESGDRHGQASATSNLGGALGESGRFDEAVTAYTEAAAIFRETGERTDEGWVLFYLGGALGESGRFDEAVTAYTEAAAIFQETGERNARGLALSNLAATLADVERFAEAIPMLNNAAAILHETGDQDNEGITLNNLANALREVERFEEADEVVSRAEALLQEFEE